VRQAMVRVLDGREPGMVVKTAVNVLGRRTQLQAQRGRRFAGCPAERDHIFSRSRLKRAAAVQDCRISNLVHLRTPQVDLRERGVTCCRGMRRFGLLQKAKSGANDFARGLVAARRDPFGDELLQRCGQRDVEGCPLNWHCGCNTRTDGTMRHISEGVVERTESLRRPSPSDSSHARDSLADVA
jgi:hypothetical protein